MKKHTKYLFQTLLIVLIIGCTTNIRTHTDRLNGQADRGKRLVSDNGMVSSAHPLASEAGLKMLKKGGNAVDAAVATAFALNVVEPNMSGVGGGGSMLIWNQGEKEADYVDFYPSKRAETYSQLDYSKINKDEFNLLNVAIPGTVDGLLQALEKHGTLSREEVMQPAIEYATEGYPVYLTLAQFILDNEEKLKRFEGAKKTFYPNGKPLQVGEILKQPELANTLKKISKEGASAFYEGENVEDVIKLLNEYKNPVTEVDFVEYEPQWNKQPLCGSYNNYKILTAPMPQTGFYLIQALNILEGYNLKNIGLPTVSSEAFDIVSSTLRTTGADSWKYVSDPNWEDIPVEGLISKEYAQERRKYVGTGSVPEKMEFGVPNSTVSQAESSVCSNLSYATALNMNAKTNSYLAQNTNLSGVTQSEKESGETTHISVVDAQGNAVALSTTISHVFGSGAWVNGFLLNNSGFNFANLKNEEDWIGNHAYRTRSSTISPTIILDENDEVRLVIGAPGGGRIPTAVLQNILYIIEYNLDPLDAVKMPRIFPSNQNPEVQIERGFEPLVLMEARNMGYDIQSLSQGYARLYLVSKENGKLIGVADPRHDGEVRGY